MNDKSVTLPVAKRLRKVGWGKETKLTWWEWYSKQERKHYSFLEIFHGGKLGKNEYFAPDLLDLTREIREMFNNQETVQSQELHSMYSDWYEEMKCVFGQKKEVDYAAEIWLSMKKEGL